MAESKPEKPKNPEKPKTIVLCSDGTGNSAAKKGDGTNVWKLFRAVELRKDNCENREQIAFYDDGVGTGNKIFRVLGGAFGWGLSRNIRDLYSFLVHHYEPGTKGTEPDRIFLFGFSRGAFTVRLVAGLICRCGIVDKNRFHGRELMEKIDLAVRHYREAHRKRDPSIAEDFRKNYGVIVPQGGPGCEDPRDVPIKCVGVWDTVDAVGLPVDELTEALDKVFKFSFHQHGLLTCVENGFHALAIDDERHTFHPVMWDESQSQAHQNVEQVWFAGVHSNVGGGYPKDQMALVALEWMMEKVSGLKDANEPCGLYFREDLRKKWSEEANVNGTLYDSRSGLAAYYRYRPRVIHELAEKPRIHHTVFDRIKRATADYAPANIPQHYRVVKEQSVADRTLKPEAWEALDLAWDMVWLRRVLYFAFVAFSLLLVVMGFRLSSGTAETCRVGVRALDPVFDLAAWAAPSAVEGWVAAFRHNTFWLVFFLVVAWLLLSFRKRLKEGTSDAGIAAWRLNRGLHVTHTPEQRWIHKLARKIRKSKPAGGFGTFKKKVLPWIVLVGAVVVLVLGIWRLALPTSYQTVAAGVKQALGIAQSAPPPDCGGSEIAQPLEEGSSQTLDFATDCACRATDVILEKGGRYRFEVAEDEQQPWKDSSLAAGPLGLDHRADSDRLWPLVPFRRSWRDPWFQLLGSIGTSHDHRFAVGEKLEDFEATATGRLYLYVNDAVSYWHPRGPWTLYENNRGTARVTVTRLDGKAND